VKISSGQKTWKNVKIQLKTFQVYKGKHHGTDTDFDQGRQYGMDMLIKVEYRS
jgi:hypothetical protein